MKRLTFLYDLCRVRTKNNDENMSLSTVLIALCRGLSNTIGPTPSRYFVTNKAALRKSAKLDNCSFLPVEERHRIDDR